MERASFFLEIGTEEIPAGYIEPALEALERQLLRFMEDYRIDHGNSVVATGTPRRLVIYISQVVLKQQSSLQEIIGPPYQVAFNQDGTPTKAAEGFAKSQKVSLEELRIVETPRGKYLSVQKQEEGLSTKELLSQKLPDFIAHIPFPKSMRWGSQSVTFARPICWITALLGDEVIPFNYGDLASGGVSFGHRFMKPEPIHVKGDYESYRELLRKSYVIVDQKERLELIRSGVAAMARSVGGSVVEDEDLLREVNNLVEYPYPLLGGFESKYLELPPEVPITVMKEHQRYFAVVDGNGGLMPFFITVANTAARDPKVVVKGNERVLRARLEDARFYYLEDRKISLDKRVEQLKEVVFHSKLGTSWEKVERFTRIAEYIAEELNVEKAMRNKLLEAARLCKADLVTGMVGEFPELQGIMGRDYALKEGKDPEVAEAIYEHYLPNKAGGPIPSGLIGSILSIADKIDTVVGCFGVGLIPTGTTDPFALRRQTLGIIRIITERNMPLSIKGLVRKSIPLLKNWITEPEKELEQGVIHFFKGRLEHFLTTNESYGYVPEAVRAGLAVGLDVLVDDIKRIKALSALAQKPDFESLVMAFKRIGNIIKEPEEAMDSVADVQETLLQEEAEQALWKVYVEKRRLILTAMEGKDYASALELLLEFKPFIDAFFESVLVMAKEESVRLNRLNLLKSLRRLFSEIADFKLF